ncbi:metallophosphoesterase family protein [Noviherbaspirillum saxi]|uniref:Phosphoesterase n=1 Tax=Noviherbaspirillum saxi TaxID=2320863 RepID=A0A3A3FN36_9BURK|nr:metallophosphoesterase family protein [Noviherbaspirillum saxi]RJF97416.1 metallophosphoesterase [Noviherbaspirillum saxi]
MEIQRIGLISDTHGLLRPEARLALSGVSRIIHAGDICNAGVLQQLEEIAPVVAVRGNNDHGEWANHLQDKEVIDIDGVTVYVVHDLHDMDVDPVSAGIKVVVSGHSHRPAVRRDKGVLYVNPGSAGPRRFRLPISIAFLEIADGVAKAELQMLEVD